MAYKHMFSDILEMLEFVHCCNHCNVLLVWMPLVRQPLL